MSENTAKKGTIIVIEDNVVNMKLVKDILTYHKFDILEACNGNEAIEQVEKHKNIIDLIIVDLQLPEIDGFQLIKRFKSDDSTNHIPIMVLSAHAMEVDMNKAMIAGCNEYVTKPINVESFITKVEKYFLQSTRNK